MASMFNGVMFAFTLTNGEVHEQIPKWIDRNTGVYPGSLRTSITGRLLVQKIQRSWTPITLIFSTQNLPPALLSQAMLDAFITAAWGQTLTHTLVIEASTKTVQFDWSQGEPVRYDEVTPTGFFDTPNPGRLYSGEIYLREKL